MNSQALGGGVMLAIGAALWALYFLPIWTKRRKFAAAEQNALRIQRTLRMLAETAELPEEVRVEATAREALAHERMLEAAGRSQLAEHEARVAEAKLAERQALLEARANRKRADALKRELIRRSHGVRIARLITATIAALALVALIVGIVFAIIGFGATLLGLSAAALLLAVSALVMMAPKREQRVSTQADAVSSRSDRAIAVSQPEQARQTERRVASSASRVSSAARSVTRETAATPASAQHLAQQQNSEREIAQAQRILELARQEAERAQREALDLGPGASAGTQSAQRAPQRPVSPATPAVDVSALRHMGVIDEIDATLPDLDAAIQRRRAAS